MQRLPSSIHSRLHLPGLCWGRPHVVVPLAINGAGVRDTARMLLLSLNRVLKTLRQSAAEVTEPAVPRRVADLELDEFWSFVGAKKRQRWNWYGFDRQRRKVVAFVNERRTEAACARLLKKLADCQVTRYHTDNWQSYKKFLPMQKHKLGKEGTRNIERHSLNFRTHVKRLQRRTICYSKLPAMHDAVLKLYIHHSTAGHHHL